MMAEMQLEDAILSRATLLMGVEAMCRVKEAKVIVFGVGGVGSWCAESLVRSGVRHLTIVDSDEVCVSNINRQRMATVDTVGQVKVEALKKILLSLLPDAEIEAVREVYCEETADRFHLEDYDYVIDAIDSLKDKALLIENATRTRAKLFSSMGAALKLDPTRVKVAEFRSVVGCPLARALRQRFKKAGHWPARKFKCVYSDELMPVCDTPLPASTGRDVGKTRINGSIMHITAIFGLTLAGLVLKDIHDRCENGA